MLEVDTDLCSSVWGPCFAKTAIFFRQDENYSSTEFYLSGSDLSCLLLKWILQSSPRLAFLRNQTLSLFWWNTFLLGPPCSQGRFNTWEMQSDRVQPLLSCLIFSPEAPSASAWNVTFLQYVLILLYFLQYVSFPVFRMSLLQSEKTLCPPLRSSSSVTSFIKSFFYNR